MVSTGDLRDLALVPVRGTVYIVSLPFVLVGRLLGLLYATFISAPVNYAKGFTRRLQGTWNWTKSSAKSLLPWNYYSSSGNAIATQTLDHIMESGHAGDHYLSDAEELLVQRRPPTRSGRKQRRRAIISSLIKALLEPTSPPDSDEEVERSDDEDRMYQLVRELINISKQETGSVRSRAGSLPVLDLEALKCHAQDKEKLLAFITELDEYVASMDSEVPNRGGKRRTCASAGNGSRDSGNRQGEETVQELLVPPGPASTCGPVTYHSVDLDGHDSEVESDSEENLDDSRLNIPYGESVVPRCRGLSPLVEVTSEVASPESFESIRNCEDLETELNAALSHLSNMTSELEDAEEAIVEARQTKITETVTIKSDQSCRGVQQADNIRLSVEKSDSFSEDTSDEFPCIPKTQPTLGITAGHNKRDLASVRKPRPPTLPKKNQQGVTNALKEDGCQSEDSHGSEYSSDEEEGSAGHRVEGLSHSLSDQLRLLAPSSLQPCTAATHNAGHEGQEELQKPSSSTSVSDLYSTVNKEAGRSVRAQSVGSDAQLFSSGSIHNVKSSSLSELEDAKTNTSESSERAPEMSLFIHDRVPPWKQMRSRSNSNTGSTGSSASTPTQIPAHPFLALHAPAASTREATPPPIPPRIPPPVPPRTPASHFAASQPQSQVDHTQESKCSSDSPGVYDKLPKAQMIRPIPFHAGQEGVYDTIPYHEQVGQHTHYLHERIEKRSELQSRPPVSWTPNLPPRNMRMRRANSAEGMGEFSEDREHPRLKRSGSERRSTPSADEHHGEHSRSSSASRRRSSSSERDPERVTRREHSSSSDHRHRHHGEHSGSSSRQQSVSERQRSSSEKHHSTSSSSRPKEIGMGSFLKILVSPSSSKSKTPSGSKESPKKREDDRTKKEEAKPGREDSKKHKHSSSKNRSKDEDRESEPIPRNESGTSLRSGVSMHSTESSSSGQD